MDAQPKTPLMEDYLAWLDGLCACWLSIQQAQCPEAFQGRGTVVPESQVTLALSGQVPVEPQPGFGEFWAELEARAEGSDEPLARLFRLVGARGIEQLAILLALAPQFNRKYERVFAYLQDDARERRATLGLAADLWALIAPGSDSGLFALCDPTRPINRLVLAQGEAGLGRSLALRESALLYLTGARHLPATLGRMGTLLPDGEATPTPGSEELADQAARFAHRCFDEGGTTGLLQIYGTTGSGRQAMTAYVAARTGRQALLLDCARLAMLPEDRRREAAESALSWCALGGIIPALYHFDFSGFSEADRTVLARDLLDTFRGGVPLLILCGEKPLKMRMDESFRAFRATIPAPSIGQQRRCWADAAAGLALPLDSTLDTRELAGIYALTPGQIRQVLTLAETDCLARNKTVIDRDAVALGARLLCSPRLTEVAEPLRPAFTWDDLVVDTDAMAKLKVLCDRIRCRWQVNEAWGFDRKLPYGKGVSVCLYGPPGTGKTMTAQVLSREFGLDAYRVDMSRIMDKYIGETEKKLAELFDAARDSNAILFFDEADALFAKRTEVGDSKDRYANVETAYLLQRMENHNGISILATNAVQNFDEAFKRRITYMIPLPMPDPETRKVLWRKVFPPEAPLEGVDLDFFAGRFELTGSSIKNVALSAAYLAAAKGSAITREEVTEAVKAEYQKTGRVLMAHELY